MNSDRVAGAIKGVVGKVEDSAGDFVGDPASQVRGMGRQLSGKAQDFHGRLEDAVSQHPMAALLTVGALGCLVGLLARRR